MPQPNNPIKTILNAQSFAVIGASREPAKVGHQIFKNLLANKKLNVYPVNPSARQILNQPVFDSLLSITEMVEVAIIAVPIKFIQPVIDDCVQKKVQAVIIVTAGFSELSAQGGQLQDQIAHQLKSANISLLGPNTLGILQPRSGINASFAGQDISAGNLALISQSGAMMTAIFSEMSSKKIGVSFAISLGNKGDISENEALEYALNDPSTKTIALYLESFSDIAKFFQLCSVISKQKPIILLKGGSSKLGQAATASHTAALATNFELLKAAQRQMGFVVVNTIEDFIQSCFFLETYHVTPENVMVITNAGGPGVNTTDVVEAQGVDLAEWSPSSLKNISQHLPDIHISNPFDILGDAQSDRFQLAIKQALADPNVDSILTIITQQAVTDIESIVNMIVKLRSKKPLTISLIGGQNLEKYRSKLRDHGIFCTEYPNEVIEILGTMKKVHSASYISERYKPMPTSPHQALYQPTLNSAYKLIKQYDVEIPKFDIATSVSETKKVLLPSFAKTANLTIKHKKLIGAIYGVVETQKEAAEAYAQLEKFGNEVLYQQIIEADHEMLVGVNHDPQFGWYMAVGLGGTQTNIINDRAYIFLPATRKMFKEAFKTTKAFGTIKQYEMKTARFNVIENIIDLLVKIQQIVIDHPEMAELEINPLMIKDDHLWIADVKMSV